MVPESGACGKKYYDQHIKGVVLQPGDRVLVRGGPGKLRSYWENMIYVVKEQMNDSPVYKVVSEMDGKRTHVLHRNLLHLVNDLPVDLPAVNEKTRTSPEKRKRPQTANKDTEPQYHSETTSEEEGNTIYYELRYDLRNRNSRDGSGELTHVHSQPLPHNESCVTFNHEHSVKEKDSRHMRKSCEGTRDQRDTENQYYSQQQSREPDRDDGEEETVEYGETEVIHTPFLESGSEAEPTQEEALTGSGLTPKVEEQSVRRSTRDRRPVTRFTYNTLDQPSHEVHPSVSTTYIWYVV